MFFFNPTYWLFMAPALILTMVAQFYVSTTYRKWSRVPNRSKVIRPLAKVMIERVPDCR